MNDANRFVRGYDGAEKRKEAYAMAAPVITSAIPRITLPGGPFSVTHEGSGALSVAGRAGPETRLRLEVDGMPFSPALVLQNGSWGTDNCSCSNLSAGLHTLAASAYASETAPTRCGRQFL